MYSNYLVLVGSKNNNTGATTNGTGFLISKKNDSYVLTCRHVIDGVTGNQLFALPKLKKTKNPPGGYYVLNLDKPKFHQEDNIIGTYDIAVLRILNESKQSLKEKNISTFDILDKQTISDFYAGDKLSAEGYPIDYVENLTKLNVSESLIPRKFDGVHCHVSINNIPQHGFNASLIEAFFVQITTGMNCGKGMSGGIVYPCNKNDQYVGIVIASGNFSLMLENNKIKIFNGFLFARAKRICEIFEFNTF